MIQEHDPAIRSLLGRLEDTPHDDKALHELWQILAHRARWADLAYVVELCAQRRRTPAAAADLHFRAGELAKDFLKDEERALRNYERASTLDPTHAKALAAARKLYLRQRRYGRASPLVPLELAAAADNAGTRASILAEIAAAHGEAVDLSNKIALLHQLSVRFPKDGEVQRAMARLYRIRAEQPGGTEQDRRRAARILARLAATARGDERVQLAEQSLEAWPGEEGSYTIVEQALTIARDEEALAERKRAFLDANGTSELAQRMRRDLAEELRAAGNLHDAIAMLKPLFAVDPYVGRALQELYRETGRLVELDKLLAEVKAEAPLDRVAMLRERAEIARQRGEQAKRVALFAELLAIDPTDEAALAAVAEDCAARGAFGELRERYAAAARAVEADATARGRWLREVARLSEEKLADDDAAIEAWLELSGFDEHRAEARLRLERLYERARRWSELATLLEANAEAATDAPEAKKLALRAIEVRRDRMNDLSGARGALERLAEKDPADEELKEALLDAKIWSGATEGLEATLKARAEEEAPAPKQAARFAQLARFYEKDDARRADALAAWRKVRTLDPTQSVAWGAEAALLNEAGKRAELLETLLAHAAQPVAATEQARLPLLLRAARLAMELGDAEKAVAAAEQASSWAPGNDEVSKLLVEVYARADAPAEERVEKKEEAAAVVEEEEPPPLSRAGEAIAPPPMVSVETAKRLESEHPPAADGAGVEEVKPSERKEIPEPPMVVPARRD